jgi:hypothetical protein
MRETPRSEEVAMRYIAELAEAVERDSELARRIQEDPVKVLEDLASLSRSSPMYGFIVWWWGRWV